MTDLDEALDDVEGQLALPGAQPLATVAEVARALRERPGWQHAVGIEGGGVAWLARAVLEAGEPQLLCLVPDAEAVERLVSDLRQLLAGLPVPGRAGQAVPAEVLSLLTAEGNPYAEVTPDRRVQLQRLATLHHLAQLPWRVLVVSASALVRRVVPPAAVRAASGHLEQDQELDVTALTRQLAAAGYLRVPVVEDPGSFAVRGGLLDVWPPGEPLPVRVELYGDLVASLKRFSPEGQRSTEQLRELRLPPVRDAHVTETAEAQARARLRELCDARDWPSSKTRQLVEEVAAGRSVFGAEQYLPAFGPLVALFDYVPADAPVLVEEPSRVVAELRAELERARRGAAEAAERPHYPVEQLCLTEGPLSEALGPRRLLGAHRVGVASSGAERELEALELVPAGAPALALRDHAALTRAVKHARQQVGKAGALTPLLRRIEAWQEAGLVVVVTARAATQAERLAALLSHRGVKVRVVADAEPGAKELPREVVRVTVGPLARGLLARAEGFVVVTEEEIFGQRRHRVAPRRRSARALLEDLRALTVGDYVVHVDHGVGRYLGLERKVLGDLSAELLVVEYQGGDKLYLPVYRLNQIQKHAGGEGAPKLDRLGGQSFAKTRAKVKAKVRQMADELLRLYAERNALVKEPLPPADDDYATFEATFPFEETRDQAQAIAEVLGDMQRARVMDRLVCGDVGFGKTEVALRATFRAALAGRQVALLCPTTVLAQQHFNTFQARLADYPVTVRSLSRFESAREQAETLKGLREGSVDVVIGTHRLLSKDVHFKRLGLLVVDEEQRFGVTHKERIKQLRSSVDALTLSATPIPRTLQMAVAGLRDMSLITTAPVDRRAIRTITSRYDEGLLREAVERELSRGGQVFYVYNRVEGIYERAAKLQALVPGARIAVGHGQLNEATLEKTMLDFVQGEYDILVATAIIESGLDIPRANTIIVDRADLFGLSQLYQLRGRVGRSSERAYCYLLVPPPSQLSDEARARIEAMERYTELGSGFQVATLDMELRGAGELLGAEQSGFAASVGFDLFCRMLEEATEELRGQPVVHEVDPELSFDVEALLPEAYVAEVGVRLSLYKRMASATDEDELAELASEMEDRFGVAPPEALRLVELMRLKVELRRLRALGVEASSRSVTLHLRDDTPLDPVKVGALIGQRRAAWRLSPDGRLTRRAVEGEAFTDGLQLADRMLTELAPAWRAAG